MPYQYLDMGSSNQQQTQKQADQATDTVCSLFDGIQDICIVYRYALAAKYDGGNQRIVV